MTFLADPRAAYERALLAAALLLAATAVLCGALFLDHALGFAPCELCLLQRWPHGLAVLAAGGALAVAHNRPRAYATLMATASAILATGAALAAYHSGVEAHLWAGPTACSGSAAAPPTGVEGLVAALKQARVVRCDVPALRVAGLSLADWNLLVSTALAAAAAAACVPAARSLLLRTAGLGPPAGRA